MLPISFAPAPEERIVSVDGLCPNPGLQLSHWPGNRTPPDLKHELSTGIALKFAQLAPRQKAHLLAEARAFCNNHYDTDGVLALYALTQSELALTHAPALLDAAASGDFFRPKSEAAFILDTLIHCSADQETSPFANSLLGLDEAQRYLRATQQVFAHLPRWLGGDFGDLRSSCLPALERWRRGRAELVECARDDLVHLDLTIWSARKPDFDPGRHAVFGSTQSDRVLLIGQARGGTSYRFILGTRSWFDLPGNQPPPRPNLARLCAQLNELERTSASAEVCWRHQPSDSPSPELWFGRAELPWFAEHAAPALALSQLAPEQVKSQWLEALRASWVFPEESAEPLLF